jgi:RNA-binding protein
MPRKGDNRLCYHAPAMALTSKQRQYLKGLAHSLPPIVRIGRGGASPAVVEETKRSLTAHELIKVRIDSEDSAQRRTLAEELARKCDAELAGTIGKLAILYRARDEKPEIILKSEV